jgi:uncharacterized protein
VFKRKCYNKLLEWKHISNGSTALLIEGARRVGKTTLAKAFAKAEYDSYLIVDFSKASTEVKRLFDERVDDISTLLRMLQLYYSVELSERHSVVIFDEVQRYPRAREAIKHLVADGRFDYIETGSLISIKKNVSDIVIPSEENRVYLRPLDFEEYLWALGRSMLASEIRNCCEKLAPLPDVLHLQAMRLFDEYLVVGGMPQAVQAFVDDETFTKCEREKRRILDLYKDDILKFGNEDSSKALAMFEGIPGQLSMASKRFKYGSLGKNARKEHYQGAVKWLEDSHIVNVCRQCNDSNVGFRLTSDDSAIKIYMGDTGLLVSHAFADNNDSLKVQRALQFGKISVNKGMLVENYVAQQLVSSGHSLFFHTWEEAPESEDAKRSRQREVDFLITKWFSDAAGKPRVTPIEVKSSKNYASTVSLDDFAIKYTQRLGKEIVLHPKQLSVVGNREYLPLYMAFCI